MAAPEDEIKSLKEKNKELVEKVQYWKMTAAQRENEKLELIKEINELRFKVIRLKSGGAAEARKLETALQSASEEALSHLVQASSAVARTIELAKTYMRDRDGLDPVPPRWSSISNNEKVHRVPPMMIGGQSIQPVVSLSRATFNLSGSRQTSRSPNASRNVTVRAVPMHMLQDVYIPLTRIDLRAMQSNNETESEPQPNDSAENIPFDASMEDAAEEPDMTDDDDYDSSRRLDVVTEDLEPESEELTPSRARVDNPLEGPSWLLDAGAGAGARAEAGAAAGAGAGAGASFEPDSTTEEHTPPHNSDSPEPMATDGRNEPDPEPDAARMFTPTVRRRKRTSTPPRSSVLDTSLGGAEALDTSRVLQVLVPKMSLGESPAPAKRRAAPRFDAPSPNGATHSGLIVSEELESEAREQKSVEPSLGRQSVEPPSGRRSVEPPSGRRSVEPSGSNKRHGSGDRRGSSQERQSACPLEESCSRRESGDEGGEGEEGGEGSGRGRTRRNRKPVTYKEKPLNRKLRR